MAAKVFLAERPHELLSLFHLIFNSLCVPYLLLKNPHTLLGLAPTVKVVHAKGISPTLLVKDAPIGFTSKRLACLLVMESACDKPHKTSIPIERRVEAASEAKLTGSFLTSQLSLTVVLGDTTTDVVHVLLYEAPIFVENRADRFAQPHLVTERDVACDHS